MQADKNIIKGNRFAIKKVVAKGEFYGIVETKKKVKGNNGSTQFASKTVIVSHFGSRLESKQNIERQAKALNGELFYFGAFKNSI